MDVKKINAEYWLMVSETRDGYVAGTRDWYVVRSMDDGRALMAQYDSFTEKGNGAFSGRWQIKGFFMLSNNHRKMDYCTFLSVGAGDLADSVRWKNGRSRMCIYDNDCGTDRVWGGRLSSLRPMADWEVRKCLEKSALK